MIPLPYPQSALFSRHLGCAQLVEILKKKKNDERTRDGDHRRPHVVAARIQKNNIIYTNCRGYYVNSIHLPITSVLITFFFLFFFFQLSRSTHITVLCISVTGLQNRAVHENNGDGDFRDKTT